MIMRDFRNDEQGKYELLDAVAFGMTLETEGSRESPFFYADHYGAFEDNGETLMSQLAVYHLKAASRGSGCRRTAWGMWPPFRSTAGGAIPASCFTTRFGG